MKAEEVLKKMREDAAWDGIERARDYLKKTGLGEHVVANYGPEADNIIGYLGTNLYMYSVGWVVKSREDLMKHMYRTADKYCGGDKKLKSLIEGCVNGLNP